MKKYQVIPVKPGDVFILADGVAVQRCDSIQEAFQLIAKEAGIDVTFEEFPSDAFYKLLSKTP